MKINRINIKVDVFVLLRFCILGEERRNPLDFEINLGFFKTKFDCYVILYMRIDLFFLSKFKNYFNPGCKLYFLKNGARV